MSIAQAETAETRYERGLANAREQFYKDLRRIGNPRAHRAYEKARAQAWREYCKELKQENREEEET